MKSIAIIGAGAAGLASAAYLAKAGFKVIVFEKNNFPGGRCAAFEKDGHRFDIGATLLMMPLVYERLFADFGKDMTKELSLLRMDPVYRLYYPNGQRLDFSSDLMKMQSQMEAMEPGSYRRFLQYMGQSFEAYQVSMKHIIDRNYDHIFQFINPVNLIRLLRLHAFGNHYKLASKYFRSENLRTAFTFQNIYVGQNPFNAPAIFSMLPFMELTDGVFFPKGGMDAVSKALERIAVEEGAEVRYRSAVERVVIAGEQGRGEAGKKSGERAIGVELSDGSFFPADIVLANADLPYVYQEMLPPGPGLKRTNKLGYTCSAVVFHWGMDAVLTGLEQHNVFVSNNYRENISAVFNGSGIAPEPSFYVHSAARADRSAAPEGQDSVSVIVPVGHMGMEAGKRGSGGTGISHHPVPPPIWERESGKGLTANWDDVKEEARASVLARLAKEGIQDVERHIKFEKVYNPPIWQNLFNLSRGATFGSLNHNLMQMGYFRPHNQHPKYRNLFFAGGSTHPGNGVPLALISARLTSEKIIEQFGER